jgi:hypothetical protein
VSSLCHFKSPNLSPPQLNHHTNPPKPQNPQPSKPSPHCQTRSSRQYPPWHHANSSNTITAITIISTKHFNQTRSQTFINTISNRHIHLTIFFNHKPAIKTSP